MKSNGSQKYTQSSLCHFSYEIYFILATANIFTPLISFEQLTELLQSPKQIVITTHHKPDGDALGSSLALYHFLRKLGHDAVVVSPTDYPTFIEWMPGNNTVINFEKHPDEAKRLVSKAELIFCLDFNKLYRINQLGEIIGATSTTKILIDHHLEPDHFADYELWSIEKSSTAELIYDFIEMLGKLEMIDSDIATCLYAGLLTDTDRFRIPRTTPRVHQITAALLEKGVDHTKVYNEIYETFSENRLRFFGYCMTKCMTVLPNLHTAILAIEGEEIRRYFISTGDTEGLVNYPMMIKEVWMTAIIIQRPDQVKLSFRSKGDIDVNWLCKEFFEGGGHKNAAGGKSELSVAKTKEKLLSILAAQKNKLNLV